MPRVVPSQVVEMIDSLFPEAKNETEGKPIRIGPDQITQLSAVLDMVGQIPAELIVLKESQYAEYVTAIAAIRSSVQRWLVVERPVHSPALPFVRGLRQHSPVSLIRQALDACPDEFPSAGTSELSFIKDGKLRDRLRLDIRAVNNAFSNSEWKAATVLAGSVIEALLLWALEEHFSDKVKDTVAHLVEKKIFKKKPHEDLQWWNLHQYVEVAAELKVLSDDTVTQVRLAKDYRNFIHPGKAQRLQQECNRSTAMTAIAALDRVTADLMKRFNPSPSRLDSSPPGRI